MKLVRHRPAGVRPLEVWDLPCRGAPLYRTLGELGLQRLTADERRALLPALLTEAVAIIRASGRAPDFEQVVVSGGWLVDVPVPFQRARDLRFAGRSAAEALLGPAGGVYLDLGQTALKVLGPSGWQRHARDLDAHPLRLVEHGPYPPSETEPARERLIDWLLGAIPAGTERVVLSLPSALDANGQPEGCTYAGLSGDFVGALRARPLDATVWLSADAELLGATARLESSARTGLALSVGFGPGAAWFTREDDHG